VTTSLPARPAPLVLAAPSGTGKTTIAHALVEGSKDFVFSTSVTTRQARKGERDGVDYEFVTPEVFRRRAEGGELVEWAEVLGNLYGTRRSVLETSRNLGKHPVLDIDVQGARQIRDRVPDAVLVFVFPPSGDVLWRRLTKRGTEDLAEVRRRLETAHREMGEAALFDYVVVNETLDRTVARVREIVASEGHRVSRMVDLTREVERIRGDIVRILADA
jgi:guanylate kinase